MTSRRYIDWFITTPTMLVSTIIFMEYLRKRKMKIFIFWDFLKEHKFNIIVTLNFFMLLFGLLTESGKIIDKKIGISIGFIFFALSFKLIYDKYASKTKAGTNLFLFLFIVWSLYGVSAVTYHNEKYML